MNLKTNLAIKFLALGLLAAPRLATAVVDVEVFNATEFQMRLTEAETDNEDNIIRVRSTNGPYVLATPLLYGSAQTNSLTVIGDGVGETILNGNDVTNVLNLSSVAVAGGNITVQDLTIRQGASSGIVASGLIAASSAGLVTIDACEFLDNNNTLSQPAGGIFTGGGGVVVRNSSFERNVTNGIQGPVFVGTFNGSNITVENNRFFQNESRSIGGVAVASAGSLRFAGNHLEGNKAVFNSDSDVGAFFLVAATGGIQFDGNLVRGNNAQGEVGGGVLGANGDIVVTNSIIAKNSAGINIGGLFVTTSGSMVLTHNTIAGNSAAGATGGLVIATSPATPEVDIYNNIIFGNTAAPGEAQDIFLQDAFNMNTQGTPINLVSNLYGDFVSACQTTPGCVQTLVDTPNLHDDPAFVDLANGDVHLTAVSPAIDAGDPDAPLLPPTDFDGVARPFGAAPDIGALEAVSGLAVEPTEIDFGQVLVGNVSPVSIVTLQNTGVAELHVATIALGDTVNFGLDVNAGATPCGSTTPTLGGGESCTVGVFFEPQSVEQFPTVLDVTSDAPNGNDSVNIRGIGIEDDDDVVTGGGCALGTNGSAGSIPAFGAWALISAAALSFRLRKHA